MLWLAQLARVQRDMTMTRYIIMYVPHNKRRCTHEYRNRGNTLLIIFSH